MCQACGDPAHEPDPAGGKDDEDPEYDEDADCVCEYPASCGGLGVVSCDGCGGDQCVCRCGGELGECPGCDDCPDEEDLGDAEED
jgi:hypothetical protein